MAIFFVCFLVYNSNLAYETSGDVQSASLIPVALIKNHNLDFSQYWDGSKAQYWFKAWPNGRVVSAYPIVTGLMAVPMYLLATFFGFDVSYHTELWSKLSSSIIAAFAVTALWLALRKKFQAKTVWLMATIFAFATNVWSVASRGLWQHGPNLLLISLFFYFLFRGERDGRALPYAGLMMGLAIWNRPANAVFFLPLIIYFIVKKQSSIIKFLGLAALPLAFMGWYSRNYYGSIWALGQTQSLNLSHNFLSGFLGLLFSPSHGLFTHAPMFVFSAATIFVVFHKKTDVFYRYLSVGLLSLLSLYSTWFMWWGGWNYGYRLLSEMTPGLIILLAFFYENYLTKHRVWKCVFFVSVAISLATEVTGAFFAPCRLSTVPGGEQIDEQVLWQWRNHPFAACLNKESLGDPGKRLDKIY